MRPPAPSRTYTDPADFGAQCDSHRPARLPAGGDDIPFARGRSAHVRRALATYARRLGLPEQRTYDMVAAVHETVVNAVRHGGGRGVVRLRSDPGCVICEVRDYGAHGAPPAPCFPGRLPPGTREVSGHGMWLVRQVSDLTVDRLDPSGSVVRLYFRLPGAQTAAGRVNS